MAKKRRFAYLSNKELLRELKHIRDKDHSSYNWSSQAKKQLKNEMRLRKEKGIMRKSAGKPKRKTRNIWML